MDLNDKFKEAAESVHQLEERPSNEQLLQLYGLYKQATVGDVQEERPGGFDFKAIAKYDSWANLKGTTKDEAKQAYIDLVDSLFA
jgi:acyl-CoA-binding protein